MIDEKKEEKDKLLCDWPQVIDLVPNDEQKKLYEKIDEVNEEIIELQVEQEKLLSEQELAERKFTHYDKVNVLEEIIIGIEKIESDPTIKNFTKELKNISIEIKEVIENNKKIDYKVLSYFSDRIKYIFDQSNIEAKKIKIKQQQREEAIKILQKNLGHLIKEKENIEAKQKQQILKEIIIEIKKIESDPTIKNFTKELKNISIEIKEITEKDKKIDYKVLSKLSDCISNIIDQIYIEAKKREQQLLQYYINQDDIAINMMKTEYSVTSNDQIKEDEKECAICYEIKKVDIDQGFDVHQVMCPGKHNFHEDCLKKCADKKGKINCPLCRYILLPAELDQLSKQTKTKITRKKINESHQEQIDSLQKDIDVKKEQIEIRNKKDQ